MDLPITAPQVLPTRVRIAVVIPCFKVTRHILSVVATVPLLVERIYVVDDGCPDQSGAYVEAHCTDARVWVLRNAVNLGVGGAVVTGYKAAIADGIDIAVKIDGDGQMDGSLIERFIEPIRSGRADYAKGTRFFSIGMASPMPGVRLIGNACLSFFSKLSSGYWSVMDPTNGYTAVHTKVLKLLPLDLIEKRYFFESDMLYHLGVIRAVVADVPIFAKYADETSHLRVGSVIRQFPFMHAKRFFRRFVYSYILRDFNLGSVTALLGGPMLLFGLSFASWIWLHGKQVGVASLPGTVSLASMAIVLGTQLLIASALYDVSNQPTRALHPML
jgi:dolichol-phosphate mannosyltransferase